MNVIYTTNSNFTGKVAASICSVFENNKAEEDITIYIIGQELTEEEKEQYQQMADAYQRKIVIIELGEISSYLDFEFDTNGWNSIVLARLLLDRLLPSDVDRVLYMDGDTINIAPLHELWRTDLKGCVLGACIEATISQSYRAELGIENLPYVNAGVLLIDLKKWRRESIGQKILCYYKENGGNFFANDQDAINGFLRENIYYLPPRYNFYNIYWFYPYKMLKKLMKDAYYYDIQTYQDSVANPAIIHYLGEERPWRKGNSHKFLADYRKYHSLTPWADEPEEEGWELYYVCWNIFNVATRPFPMLRYRIINGLIPWFMKWRKKQLAKKKNG